jgi:hypothetical protein
VLEEGPSISETEMYEILSYFKRLLYRLNVPVYDGKVYIKTAIIEMEDLIWRHFHRQSCC